MSTLWQHKLVLTINLDIRYLTQWFGFEPVSGIRKTVHGLVADLENVVVMGLQRSGTSEVIVDGSRWLCRDEESRWWVMEDSVYSKLNPDHYVTLFPNEATWRQVMALRAIEKLRKDFEAMSEQEQRELYNEYPNLFIKCQDGV